MSSQKARLILCIGGLFFLFDRLLKWQALTNWTNTHLLSPYFGWQPFFNTGIAFSLPIPKYLILVLTLPILVLIAYLLIIELKRVNKNTQMLLALSLILAGALSNFFDRLIYKNVVDYFLIGTAIINISDIMIVVGLGLYLLNVKKPTQPLSS